MRTPSSTFADGRYLVIKLGNDNWWGVYEHEGGSVWSRLSPPGNIKSKPAAIQWLWNFLAIKHNKPL